MKRLANILLFFTLMTAGFSVFGQTSEYILKAVFFEKFSRFIAWPATPEFADTTKPFVISVIGINVFEDGIEKVYAKQKIKNKRVEVRKINSLDDIGNTNMLFISYSEGYRLNEILKFAEGKTIVTVSDTKGFCEEGVMINFFIEAQRMRFEINEPVVKGSKMQFSYMLLNQAKIVKK
jgi:hypothetical protein